MSTTARRRAARIVMVVSLLTGIALAADHALAPPPATRAGDRGDVLAPVTERADSVP